MTDIQDKMDREIKAVAERDGDGEREWTLSIEKAEWRAAARVLVEHAEMALASLEKGDADSAKNALEIAIKVSARDRSAN